MGLPTTGERVFWVLKWLGVIVGISIIVIMTLGYFFTWTWTGVREDLRPLQPNEDLQRAKLLWDWLQLLIVPAALVIAGFWINTLIERSRNKSEEAQRIREREIATQHAQDEALQAYLEQMGDLLTQGLRPSNEVPPEVRTLARALTLSVLRRLDPSRKASVIQFLDESGLIQSNPYKGALQPVLALNDADLSGVNLRDAELRFAHMRRANLSRADLSNAKLRQADLRAANLSDAILRSAYLGDAKLARANLSRADLTDAEGITEDQLEQQAASLERATMLNGQNYEDRLQAQGRGPAPRSPDRHRRAQRAAHSGRASSEASRSEFLLGVASGVAATVIGSLILDERRRRVATEHHSWWTRIFDG
jgi:hypothetical protein